MSTSTATPRRFELSIPRRLETISPQVAVNDTRARHRDMAIKINARNRFWNRVTDVVSITFAVSAFATFVFLGGWMIYATIAEVSTWNHCDLLSGFGVVR